MAVLLSNVAQFGEGTGGTMNHYSAEEISIRGKKSSGSSELEGESKQGASGKVGAHGYL